MISEPRFLRSLAEWAAILGVGVVLIYLIPKILPLPERIDTLLYVYQGPLMAFGFLGIFGNGQSRGRTSVRLTL